jgi:hypothetical protein
VVPTGNDELAYLELATDFRLPEDGPMTGPTRQGDAVDLGRVRRIRPGVWDVTTRIDWRGPASGSSIIACTGPRAVRVFDVEFDEDQTTEVEASEDSFLCNGPNGIFFAPFNNDIAVTSIVVTPSSPAPVPRDAPAVVEGAASGIEVVVTNVGDAPEVTYDLVLSGVQGIAAASRLDLAVRQGESWSEMFSWTPLVSVVPDDQASREQRVTATATAHQEEELTADNAWSLDIDVVGDDDGDGVANDWPGARDNCPDIPNAGQENCDGDARGDACDNPEIRELWPYCPRLNGQVTVLGFFGSTPSGASVNGQPVVLTSSACRLVFQNPIDAAALTFTLASPPLSASLCPEPACPGPIEIRAIDPVTMVAGSPERVRVFGCGFNGVTVDLEQTQPPGGRTPMTTVTVVDERHFHFTIPSGFQAGLYRVVAVAGGQEAISSEILTIP